VRDTAGEGGEPRTGPDGGQKPGTESPPAAPATDWRLVSEANQFTLRALRMNWGRSYAINFDGTDWTARPRDLSGTVITHEDPQHLSTLISLDYTRRALQSGRARHDDTWYREGFSSST
jgi:hypothetical protein